MQQAPRMDEAALVEALRRRLRSLPPAALAERFSLSQLALLCADGVTPFTAPLVEHHAFSCDDGRRAIVDTLLAPRHAANQYVLGVLTQRQHVAGGGGALGDAAACAHEARAWFLAAARHGHAAAHDAVASYFLTKPRGATTFKELRPSYHDAAFHLWVGARLGGVGDARETLDELVTNDTQKQLLPLATKDIPEGCNVSGAERQRLVRLLHLGPRLADAAAAPYDDPAAQFLLAMQALGTPAPCLMAQFPDVGGVVCVFNFMLCDAPASANAPAARALLQRAAAQSYAPARAFLASAGAADFAQPQRLLGALNEQLASLLTLTPEGGREGITSVVWRAPRNVPRTRRHEVEAQVQRTAAALQMAGGGPGACDVSTKPLMWRAPRVPCAHCGRPDVLTKACSGCNAAAYCGLVCQRAAWRGHKVACRAAAAARATGETPAPA